MKVSFTHLIAWAIVEAAREWPVMGRAYAEEDGKPQVIEPGGVNLGIAVDVERKDGSRSLMVPVHQGRRRARLRRLPRLLRGPDHQDAREQAHRRRLPGHEHHAHQPGRPRDGRLGAAPDGRPGHDRRHRLDRLPGRVGPRAGRQAQGARRLEGDDDDVDLRPPHHPGRRVGLVPAPHRPAAPGRGRASTSPSPESLGIASQPSSPPPTPPPPRPRRSGGAAPPAPRSPPAPDTELLQAVQAATSLLKAYRTHGHLAARLDPLGARAEGRSGARAREPQPDPGADVEDPGLDPADRGRGRDPARGAAADARRLLRDDRLPDRAPLLPPAADLAAGDDRDRRAPQAARQRRRSAPCSPG